MSASEPLGGQLSLAGRHALVCGASAGIGRASALALASLGARITVLARRRDVLEAFLPALRSAGASAAAALVADLDDPESFEPAVRALLDAGGAVQVLVNNSGGPAPGAILASSPAHFAAGFTRVLYSAQSLVQMCLPGMREAGFGRIVNVLSTSVREPIPNLGVGNTVRGAMAGWAKTLSRELPAGVTINSILPGYTATERLQELAELQARNAGRTVADIHAEWTREIPEGRLAAPNEIGNVIAFLCSPAAAYVRGQSIAVDGGRMRSI
jgi:3-oxoacyl-[acyl-carrier protein] reductase